MAGVNINTNTNTNTNAKVGYNSTILYFDGRSKHKYKKNTNTNAKVGYNNTILYFDGRSNTQIQKEIQIQIQMPRSGTTTPSSTLMAGANTTGEH